MYLTWKPCIFLKSSRHMLVQLFIVSILAVCCCFCWSWHFFKCNTFFKFSEAQVPRLTDRANLLTNFLWSRKRAVEDVALRKKAMSLEKHLWEKAIEKGYGGWFTKLTAAVRWQKCYSDTSAGDYLIFFADLDEELLEDRIRKKVLFELRRTTYHWTPLK